MYDVPRQSVVVDLRFAFFRHGVCVSLITPGGGVEQDRPARSGCAKGGAGEGPAGAHGTYQVGRFDHMKPPRTRLCTTG